MDKETIDKIKDLKILKVADSLNISYSTTGTWRKTKCWIHDDHHPSLGLLASGNTWKCFACKRSGNVIDMVMEIKKLSFDEACKWLIRQFNIIETNDTNIQKTMSTTTLKETALHEKISWGTVKGESSFTRAMVKNQILSPEQMAHAIDTFRLATYEDRVVFLQIDLDGEIRDGKVMFYEADGHRSHRITPFAYSYLLKKQGKLPQDWTSQRCLFGLHQLRPYLADPTQDYIVAIVESEKTAVICSELLPYHKQGTKDLPILWMATGGKTNLSIEVLRPLFPSASSQSKLHMGGVLLFPDTDTTGENYADWLQIAMDASQQFKQPITVSDLLERCATQEQKERKIDIADLLEN